MSRRTPFNSRAKRQHFVPQLLLRHFCAEGSNRLWVFDKHTGKVCQQAIREIGHQKYFNEASLGDGWVVSYDEKFQHIEDRAAPGLAKLNDGAPTPQERLRNPLRKPQEPRRCHSIVTPFLPRRLRHPLERHVSHQSFHSQCLRYIE